MVKKTVLATGALVGVLLLVVIVRTLVVTPPHTEPPNSSLLPVPIADSDRNQLLKRLSKAIQHKTISRSIPASSELPFTSRVDAGVFRAFHEFLRVSFPATHQGLTLQKVDDFSLLFKWSGSQPDLPAVIFLAHQDVVPAALDTVERWSFPPFSGAIANGFVWGRGTLDNKSSLMAILEAVETLVNNDWQPTRTIYLAFGHDEEIGGNGARAMALKLWELAVKPAMVIDEGGFVLTGVLPGIKQPVALTGIAEKGYLSVRLSAKRLAGHSSMPPPQTAAEIIAAAVTRLGDQPPSKRLDGATALMFAKVSPHMPFLMRAIFSNLWLFEPMVLTTLAQKPTTNATIRTTQAVTMLASGVKENVLPASASAVINYRLLPGDSVQGIVSHIRQVVDDKRVNIAPLPSASPATSLSTTDTAGYKAIESTVRAVFAGEDVIVAPYLTVGATDARHFAEVAENQYRLLPILLDASDLQRIHGLNERIRVDEYLRMIQFYTGLIVKLTNHQTDS